VFEVRRHDLVAAPVAPRKIFPPRTIPPPTPVPIVSITSTCGTSSGSAQASARAAQVASLSTKTGTLRRLPRTSRRGTRASGMLTLKRAVPVAKSTTLGTAIPTA
jgi:hypothetical protein